MAKTPTNKATDDAKAAVAEQFAEADAKAQPETARERRERINAEFDKASDKRKAEIITETQVGLGVRGY